MKKILIFGGTSFVGRNIVEFLLKQDSFQITLFNRNVSNPNLYENISRIEGNRNNKNDVKKIHATDWDYIIDVSCYYPHQLRYVLQGNLKTLANYIFISTCSVYDNEKYQDKLREENAPILSCSEVEEKDESLNTYGNRKAECERILKNSGIAYTILRPALIYGKYDPTDRFYYWLYQVKKQKEIVFPENGERLFSLTCVGDLTRIIFHILKQKTKYQTFNCISNPTMSIAEIVKESEKLYRNQVQKIYASAEFLKEKKVAQWSGIPLWLNTDMFTHSNKKLKQFIGFEATNLEEGIKSADSYYKGLSYPKPKFGINETKKNKLIHELK